jgi:uncharacterized membrane protein YtjA (UPF0391 family)
MFLLWPAIVSLIAIISAILGFTDLVPAASESARLVFYLVLALAVLLLVIGFLVIGKLKSFARGFGINVSWTVLLGLIRWVRMLRNGRFRR